MNDRKLVLIVGGARSGKSAFAQRLAEGNSRNVLFVATAEAADDEMAARIAKHREERPAQWQTLEAPRAVARALAETNPPRIIILDCVTLWVSNLLLDGNGGWEAAAGELEALLAWYRSQQIDLIVVSNEVGLGIVPGDELSRNYRDWLGRFNQRLAGEADEVYMMIAGLPIEVKSLAKR